MAAGMPDPNNVLLHDRKLAFMCIPKAGNTSIKLALMEWYGLRGDPHRVFKCCEVPKGYFAIAFVRHPYSRLLSCYADKILKNWMPSLDRFGMSEGMGLQDFIDAVCATPDKVATGSGQHFRSQYYDLQNRPNITGRVERFKTDWRRVQRLLPGLPDLGHHNAIQHDLTLTPDQKHQIDRRYAADWVYM